MSTTETYTFACPNDDCQETAMATIDMVLEVGTPQCPACDCDMYRKAPAEGFGEWITYQTEPVLRQIKQAGVAWFERNEWGEVEQIPPRTGQSILMRLRENAVDAVGAEYEDEDAACDSCGGTGEGMVPESTCGSCGGYGGVVAGKPDLDYHPDHP
jgi:hypothetical protein